MFDGTFAREKRRGVVLLVVVVTVINLLTYFGDWRWVVPLERLAMGRQWPTYWDDGERRDTRYPYRVHQMEGCVRRGRISKY